MWRPMDAAEFTRDFGSLEVPGGRERFRVADNTRFQFSTRSKTLGQICVSHTVVSPFTSTGGALGSSDEVHIGFVEEGAVVVPSVSPSRLRSNAPATYVFPAWHEIDIECPETTCGIDIAVSGSHLADRGITLRDRDYGISPGSEVGQPLHIFASALLETPLESGPATVNALVTERALDDLIVGVFMANPAKTLSSEELRAGLRLRAASLISDSHRFPDLTPAVIADSLGVSLRHLQRAFAESDLSVARLISASRADTAALLLRSAEAASLTMNEVAARAGFASASELRAAFVSRYRVRPSEYRALHAAAVPIQLHRHGTAEPFSPP